MVNWAKVAEEREKKMSELQQRIDELAFEKDKLEMTLNETIKQKEDIEAMWKEKPTLQGDSAEQISELELLIGSLQSENRQLRQNQNLVNSDELEAMKKELELKGEALQKLEKEREEGACSNWNEV